MQCQGTPHTQSPFIRVISLPQRDNPPARQAALYRIAVNSRGTLALEENRTLCVNGGRRSVHRLVARASRSRFEPFVYTVVARGWWAASGRNSVHKSVVRASRHRFEPFVYTVAAASNRGDAIVYTDWSREPLGAELGHLCTLLRCRDGRRMQ
mgnify:FL=1